MANQTQPRVAIFVRTTNDRHGNPRTGWIISRLHDPGAFPEDFIEAHGATHRHLLEQTYPGTPVVAWIEVPVRQYNRLVRQLSMSPEGRRHAAA